MVNVYNGFEIIAEVEYNNLLDVWNGSNFQNGGTGIHLGITRLENGQYVLIHGSDWQGSQDSAEIISDKEAYENIKKYNPGLLYDKDYPKFHDLQKFDSKLIKEME